MDATVGFCNFVVVSSHDMFIRGKFFISFRKNLHWVRLVKNLIFDVEFPLVRKRVRPINEIKRKEKTTRRSEFAHNSQLSLDYMTGLDIVFF